MIDNDLIKLLNSPDPEKRKKAVTALAKTKNPQALKYLAMVVKNDDDPEVVDLARKAGAYIKKNTDDEQVVKTTAGFAEAVSPYGDSDTADDALPEDIEVTAADETRAKGFIQQSIDWHMRGDNDKAALYLRRAFAANPKLRYDSYTVGLAVTITGLSSEEAVKRLLPSAEIKKKLKRAGGMTASPTQRFLAFIMFAAAMVSLVAYLTLPWIDLSPIPTTLEGQTTQFGTIFNDSINLFRSIIQAQRANAQGANAAQLDTLISVLNGLKISLTGLDVALVSNNINTILDVTGFSELDKLSALSGQPPLEVPPAVPAQPLDRTLLFVPLVAVVAMVMGLLLLTRRRLSSGLWGISVLVVLVGMVPYWHFYMQVRQALPLNANALDVGSAPTNIADLTSVDVTAFGFWISLVVQLLLLCLPFLALLSSARPTENIGDMV